MYSLRNQISNHLLYKIFLFQFPVTVQSTLVPAAFQFIPSDVEFPMLAALVSKYKCLK